MVDLSSFIGQWHESMTCRDFNYQNVSLKWGCNQFPVDFSCCEVVKSTRILLGKRKDGSIIVQTEKWGKSSSIQFSLSDVKRFQQSGMM